MAAWTSNDRARDEAKRLRAENAKLKVWIKWALGEETSPEGKWFDEYDRPLEAPYWWRKYLRLALKD